MSIKNIGGVFGRNPKFNDVEVETLSIAGNSVPDASTLLVDGDIGTNVQAYDAGLQSISGLTTDADKMIYTTGADTYAVTDLTSAGRAILDDADAAAQRTTLGLGTIATQAADNVNIDGGAIDGTAIGSSSVSTGKFSLVNADETYTATNATINNGQYIFNNSNNPQGISYSVTRFAIGTPGTLVQFSIPASQVFLAIEGFICASRSPVSSVGVSRVGKFYMAIARAGSGTDVTLDSNLNSENWEVATTDAGGTADQVALSVNLTRGGAEANTEPQLVNITMATNNTSGTGYGAGYMNVISAGTATTFTINF